MLTLTLIKEWLEQAVSNDEDLFGGLVEQCDTKLMTLIVILMMWIVSLY